MAKVIGVTSCHPVVVGYRKAWNRTQSESGGREGGMKLQLPLYLAPFPASPLCVLHVTQMDSFNLIVILEGKRGRRMCRKKRGRDTKMVLAVAE